MADKKITSVNVQSLREALAQAVTGKDGITAHALLVVADGKPLLPPPTHASPLRACCWRVRRRMDRHC